MLVNEFLERTSDKYPDKIALISGDRRLTFLQIEHLANCLANAFLDLGLQRQERVAIYLEPSIEAIISIFAALKAGGIFVVINPQIKSKKLVYMLNDCQVKILVSDSYHVRELFDTQDACPNLHSLLLTDYEVTKIKENKKSIVKILSYEQALNQHPVSQPAKQCIDIDLATLIYTSGSTGFPKGVMLTHLNIVTAANSIIEYLENAPKDIIINLLPLSFDYGLYQVLMAFKFGGTVIQEQSFLYPYRVVELLIKEKVTGFPIVPAIAAVLFKIEKIKKCSFSHLRYLASTGQALPPNYINQLQKIFTGAKIYSMYGLTECKRVSYLPPDEINRRPTSVGKAIPNTEVYIVDGADKKINEPHKIGELVVRGAHVMKGYWNLPELTEKVLRPGPLPDERVLYTGDLFKMDSEGFLYFVSRKDDMIKVGGALVSPKEVENVLYEIKDVQEAAVVGIKDEITGQAIKAFVALKDGARLKKEDIQKYCGKRIENFMVPKYIEIRKELPKSSHGKISKRDLI